MAVRYCFFQTCHYVDWAQGSPHQKHSLVLFLPTPLLLTAMLSTLLSLFASFLLLNLPRVSKQLPTILLL